MIQVLVVIVAFACAQTSTTKSNFKRADQDLGICDNEATSIKNDFSKIQADLKNKDWVKKKIQNMTDIDQFMRKQIINIPTEKNYTKSEKEYFRKELSERLTKIDTENTNDLKKLLTIYQWFKISMFGKETDSNAWLLVQHADDQPDFQKHVLITLSGLYKSKETRPENYAYLFDRLAASYSDLSKRQLQRYGTQGTCAGPGTWIPLPMEEPDLVNVRRAEVGFGTMNEYTAIVKEICR